ncbi:oligosaccharide flippase family protein [Kaistella antarctica]|nr:oligosaccharide flippase family protein [Kaistella antarctica]KEY18821.1 hypothetical protein HY04_10130 [Kaistella antarctica]
MIKFLKKTSIIYSASSVFKSGVQLLVGLAIAKFITPGDFGIWSSFNLILTYTIILQLGIVNGLNLELPLAIGKGDNEKAEKLVQTTQSYIAVCIALLALAGGFYLLFFTPDTPKFFYGAIAIVVLVTFSFYQDFITATFRTQQSFFRFSIINIVQALVNLTTIVFIIYYAYYGLLIKSIIVLAIYVALLHYYRPFPVKFFFDKKLYLKLIKTGLPIFILAYVQSVATSFDRLLILKYLDISAMGIYSFAYLGFSSITLFSGSIASYIYPTMTENFAKNNNAVQLWIYLKKNISLIFLGLLILAIIGSLLIPYVTEAFFPNYIESVPVMQILFFAGVFNGSVIGVNVLLSMKKWKLIVIYHTIFSLLLVICPFVFMYYSDNKIMGIAYGVLIANFINLINGYILVYFATVKSQYVRK